VKEAAAAADCKARLKGLSIQFAVYLQQAPMDGPEGAAGAWREFMEREAEADRRECPVAKRPYRLIEVTDPSSRFHPYVIADPPGAHGKELLYGFTEQGHFVAYEEGDEPQ
jgi:hypothetical protein